MSSTKHDKLSVLADIVKQNVNAVETAQALGLEVRKNRCRCPVHNGSDFNCVLNRHERGFYCHVCKSHGDVIALVESVTGMNFIDSLRWFNDTFGLNMSIDSPIDDTKLKQAKKRLKKRADDRAFQERIESLDYDMYLSISSVLERLENQRDENRPRRYSDDWNDKFCNAVELIPIVKKYMEYFAIASTVVRT